MAHTRIRKFNTRETYPEQNLDNDLCQAVVTQGGKTVWMRGQCPQNLDDAKIIESHDPVEQTHMVMKNIQQLIEEAGGEMTHLVKVVVYITDVRHREAVYRTMGEYIKGVYPVSTGLVVQALARPDWLVKIDATAVIPEWRFHWLPAALKPAGSGWRLRPLRPLSPHGVHIRAPGSAPWPARISPIHVWVPLPFI